MPTAPSTQERYLFVVTDFDKEPDLTAVPLVLANNALAAGADVLLWTTHEGVRLARNGAAHAIKPASFPTLGELLESFREGGGRIGVCPPCGKTHGVTDESLAPNASWMGASALLAEMQGRRMLSF
jgi:predicted peroxiredoxin